MSTAPQAAIDPLVHLVPIQAISIPEDRQREKAEADDTLVESIRQRGLLQPIIIRNDGTGDGYILIAGERRLDAHRKLKLPTIRATLFESLTPIQQFEVELMENLARKDLTWQEEVKAIGVYHSLRLSAFSSWTQLGTANALGLSTSTISEVLVVYTDMGDPEVAACPTRRGAFNLIKGRAERAAIAAHSRGIEVAGAASIIIPAAVPFNATPAERTAALLASVDLSKKAVDSMDDLDKTLANIKAGRMAAAALAVEQAKQTSQDLVLNADFLEWAEGYTGPKFDVIHVDFPYGKGYTGSNTRRTGKATINPVYADDPDIYRQLVEGFLSLQNNFAFPAAHCIFWFDMSYYQWTIDMFEAAGWTLVQPFPLIWTKGAQGVASDTRRRPRHCYETALLFSRGDRKISKLVVDHFDARTDEKLHLNQKPLAMLEHFLTLVVDEHTAVLDPTCGSGSALVAAKRLKAARIFGVELDSSNADVARFLLQRHFAAAPTEETSVDSSHSSPG
jgi:ParB-like partition proteins